MPRFPQNFVLSLDSLTWDTAADLPTADFHLWPTFFKVDGTTASVDKMLKVMGTATVTGATGAGPGVSLAPGDSVAIPGEIGQWADQVVPLPVDLDPPLGPDFPGFFGMALLAIDPGGLETDALLAGRAALNDSLQSGLNEMILTLPAGSTSIDEDHISALQNAIRAAVTKAIEDAVTGVLDKLHVWFDAPKVSYTFAHFNQDELPANDFDQRDFDPTATSGPAPIGWLSFRPGFPPSGLSTPIALNGAISRSRRNVGAGVLGRFPSSGMVRAVAGFQSPDGYHHAIAATANGDITEMYWQGPDTPGQGGLSHFASRIVGLAGYSSADGYQQVIAATADGSVTEMYWQGGGESHQGTLSHFTSPIMAIAAYSAADGYQHVIVATADGDLTELWWLTGDVGRGRLTNLGTSLIAGVAGYEAGGVNHVIAATSDGTLTELTWSGAAPAIPALLAKIETQQWNSVQGLAAYDSAGEQHVIVRMSNGTLRELHTPSQGQRLHTDLASMPNMWRQQQFAFVPTWPIIAAYADASGYEHVIAATTDGDVHELWWHHATSSNNASQ
jgi:hypothetical protein